MSVQCPLFDKNSSHSLQFAVMTVFHILRALIGQLNTHIIRLWYNNSLKLKNYKSTHC